MVHDIEGYMDEYNSNCSDKCLPGYVKCESDYHYLEHCDSDNHPENYHNYATGEGEDLQCYEWCCKEFETFCHGNCIDDDIPLGYSYDHPV